MISNKNFNNNVNIEGTNFSDCNFYGNSSAPKNAIFKDCKFYGIMKSSMEIDKKKKFK